MELLTAPSSFIIFSLLVLAILAASVFRATRRSRGRRASVLPAGVLPLRDLHRELLSRDICYLLLSDIDSLLHHSKLEEEDLLFLLGLAFEDIEVPEGFERVLGRGPFHRARRLCYLMLKLEEKGLSVPLEMRIYYKDAAANNLQPWGLLSDAETRSVLRSSSLDSARRQPGEGRAPNED